MQKTSSNPRHMYKPLPKKDPSCFICASLLGDVEFIIGLLYFSSLWLCTDLFHRLYLQGPCAHLYMSTRILLPRTQMISYISYPVLHLSAKRPSPALWSVLLQVLLPSFYKEVNCLQELFIFSSCFHLILSILGPHTTIRWHFEQDLRWC